MKYTKSVLKDLWPDSISKIKPSDQMSSFMEEGFLFILRSLKKTHKVDYLKNVKDKYYEKTVCYIKL